jgi:sporulation protein YlmC with PRC-barrel domain
MAMTIVAFVYMGTNALAAGMNESTGKTHEEATQAVGKIHDKASLSVVKEVKNMQGKDLGKVKDFVRDSDGRISLAIVSTGGFMGISGKEVAVPYSAFSYDSQKGYLTCAVSKDQLASALEVKDKSQLKDRSFAEEVYRHFGQRPYWSEES